PGPFRSAARELDDARAREDRIRIFDLDAHFHVADDLVDRERLETGLRRHNQPGGVATAVADLNPVPALIAVDAQRGRNRRSGKRTQKRRYIVSHQHYISKELPISAHPEPG